MASGARLVIRAAAGEIEGDQRALGGLGEIRRAWERMEEIKGDQGNIGLESADQICVRIEERELSGVERGEN